VDKLANKLAKRETKCAQLVLCKGMSTWLTFTLRSFSQTMSKEASSSSESVPILGKGRVNIDTWERRFNDYSISKKWRGLFRGTEERPLEINHAELQMIPTASRYNATRDRKKEIEDFNDRSEAAFGALLKAMQEDPLIYASAEMDVLREADQHDPAAAYNLVILQLRPTHVDAQMTAETKISTFQLLAGENIPASVQRLQSYVNCLEVQNRPDDNTLKRHIKRAIKGNTEATKIYFNKVESMMDRDPPISFGAFVQGLSRKFEETQAEAAQEAALHTEGKQAASHQASENEVAKFSKAKGERKGGKGRGGRGRGKSFGKGQHDSRIGALYYGKGGYDPDSWESHDQPFHRGGYRHNGGRGYEFRGKGGKGRGGGRSKGSDYYSRQPSEKRSNPSDGPKFDGHCNRCYRYGHKQADCYAKDFNKRPRT
jgi:hypothetical protein